MNFPSPDEIARADTTQLEKWFRWLDPTTSAEESILDFVTMRCAAMGVFDDAFWAGSRLATALHEAAHAAVALSLGIPVLEVQIVSNEEGFCMYGGNPPESEEEITRHIICLHAGKWAEANLAPGGSFRHSCSKTDDDNARSLFAELCMRKTDSYGAAKRDEIDTRLVEEVAMHEPQIRRIAQGLITARKLTGKQIRDL